VRTPVPSGQMDELIRCRSSMAQKVDRWNGGRGPAVCSVTTKADLGLYRSSPRSWSFPLFKGPPTKPPTQNRSRNTAPARRERLGMIFGLRKFMDDVNWKRQTPGRPLAERPLSWGRRGLMSPLRGLALTLWSFTTARTSVGAIQGGRPHPDQGFPWYGVFRPDR